MQTKYVELDDVIAILMETIVEKLPIYEVDINEKPFEENT